MKIDPKIAMGINAAVAAVLITVAQHEKEQHAGKPCPGVHGRALELIMDIIAEGVSAALMNVTDLDPTPRKPGDITH